MKSSAPYKLHKRAYHQSNNSPNDRTVIATVGNEAILQTDTGSREVWERTSHNAAHYKLIVDGKPYQFKANLSPMVKEAVAA